HVLRDSLALMRAEWDFAIVLRRRQQDAPAVLRHLDVIELGPAFGIDRHRGPQIDQRFLEALGPHVLPPVEIARVPAFERPQSAAILGEVDVVWNLFAIVDVDNVRHRTLPQTLLVSNTAFWPVP